MTEIYVPYVSNNQWGGPHPETLAFLQNRAIFANLTGDDFAYHNMLAKIWSFGRDFIIIEQDMLPTIEDLQEFEDCPEPWCCNSYDYEGKDGRTLAVACLGCTRFRSEIIKKAPDLFRIIGTYNSQINMSWHPKHWVHQDGLIWRTLYYKFGVKCHMHVNKVQHLRTFDGRMKWV